MRTRLGWALTVLGVLIAILGAAVMIVLGPDSRFSTGPHSIETDDKAVVTAPKVISWADVQVDLLAEVPVRKPIFVGIGNSVDVESFVGKTKRLEVTGFHTPWKVKTSQVDGGPNLPGAPTALDWWLKSSAGLGGASISMQLPDQTVSVAILSVGSSNLSGLQVTFAYGIKGGFAKGVGLLLFGLGLVWLGLLLRRGVGFWTDDSAKDGSDDAGIGVEEEIVYVYVDEDGVEHEISAEEAEEFEIIEDVIEEIESPAKDVEWGDAEPPEDEPLEVAPVKSAPKMPGVLTAADIVGGAEPESAGDPNEQIVYVFVDEDGVEHEVSADELAEFEIVDEEDET